MSTLLTPNAGFEGLQPTETIELTTPTWAPDAVYESGTTANGTYNGETAYEGSGYWIFKSGNYWCKNATKTNNYWEADIIALDIGQYGFEASSIEFTALATTKDTTNYFGNLIVNQSGVFETIGAQSLLGSHFSIDVDSAFNAIGSLDYSWNIQGFKVPNYEANTQAKTTWGLIVGDAGNTLADSVNFPACNVSTGYYNFVEGNCQALEAIGQDDYSSQLEADTINSSSGTSVNADEVVYDEDYVRTSANSGTSFPGAPSEGDLFYRTDMRCLYVYDGDTWLVPTEGFPEYSQNNWDAVKEAWGRILPRWQSVSLTEPRITALDGNYGDYVFDSGGNVSAGSRWTCVHPLINGDLIALPDREENALLIDPSTDNVTTINFTGNNRAISSALYGDYIYYCDSSGNIKRFNTTDNTIVSCSVNLAASYYSGILYDEKIYFVESANAGSVVAFDPTDNSTTTYTNDHPFSNITRNGVLGPDNKIYILPYRTDDFIVSFDPSDGSFESIDIDLTINTDDKRWSDAILGPDGFLYIPPNDTDTSECGAYYNPMTGEWGMLSGFSTSVGSAFYNGTTHPTGKIVWGPGNDLDSILILDTETKTTSEYNFTTDWQGQHIIQLAGNGHLYCFPRYDSSSNSNKKILKIELGESMPLDSQFPPSIYFDL